MTEVDLNFVAKQLQRLIDDSANQRDSIDVLTAMVVRLEGTGNATLTELRAMQRQLNRMNDRIRRLEDAGLGD